MNFHYLMNLYFLYNYSKQLETGILPSPFPTLGPLPYYSHSHFHLLVASLFWASVFFLFAFLLFA